MDSHRSVTPDPTAQGVRDLPRGTRSGRRAAWSRDDLRFLAEWPALKLAAMTLPEKMWFSAARRIENAKTLIGLAVPAARAETIRRALDPRAGDAAARIARDSAACRTEHRIQLLKSTTIDSWKPEIQIEGRSHLECAAAQGRGIILWVAPFCFSPLVTAMALRAAGYPMTHLGLGTHGFSMSAFGIRWLNPQCIQAEARQLRHRITIDPANPGGALHHARRELARNGVVSILMGAWAGRTVIRGRLFGGWLPLAIGAPGLAHRTGAALLPVFTTRMPGGGAFQVRIGAPLPTGAKQRGTAISHAVTSVLTELEAAIRHAPDQWLCWQDLRFDEGGIADQHDAADIHRNGDGG